MTRDGKLGIGVIGAGGIARAAHLPNYKKLPDRCQVLAVCDVVDEAARRAAADFEVPHHCTDYRELLRIDEIDAVSVCTPNAFHKEATVAALKAGKHVLVEKPMAVSAREGEAMVRAAAAAGRQLMCGLNNRFRPEVQAFRRFIEDGYLGRIYYARAQALRRRGIPGWGVFIDKELQGGGPLIDIGVHIIDLTLYLMGLPQPVAASGCTYTMFGRRDDVVGLMGQWDPKRYTVEDFAGGLVRFQDGATMMVETSFAANIDQDVFNSIVLGDRAGCQISPPKLLSEEKFTLMETVFTSLPRVDTHFREIELFVDALLEGKPVPIPGEEALVVTRILDGLYRSAEQGREVKISAPAAAAPGKKSKGSRKARR